MLDSTNDLTFVDELSEVERDFFRAGDELDNEPASDGSYESGMHEVIADEDEWEQRLASADAAAVFDS